MLLVDGELVEQHLGALVGVRRLDAGDEAHDAAPVAREQEVVARVVEEAAYGVVAGAGVDGGRVAVEQEADFV